MSDSDRNAAAVPPRAGSGIPGFDDILGGGFPSGRFYLIQGNPGTGKTTLGLQFVREGVARGESTLYVALAETADELGAVAASHGWSLDAVAVLPLAASKEPLASDEEYTIVDPSEMELGVTMKAVFDEIERARPTRLVFDSLTGLRLLARDPLRYRRQFLSLKQFLAERHCTTLLIDDDAPPTRDLQLHTVCHGVVTLERLRVDYGRPHRRLEVTKLRGTPYREGYHDLTIVTGGLVVFPRLVASEHRNQSHAGLIASGVAELDLLLGGGVHRGTSALFLGPAGAGKSVLATQYVCAAAARGEHAAVYVFDETVNTYLMRTRGLGLDLDRHIEAGLVSVQQIDPGEVSPGEFVHRVRARVDREGARVIVIDSLNGYLNAMREERSLIVQMHELLAYLSEKGVLTLLVVAQHGLVASQDAPLDVSYLADTVVLLRYFEVAGHVRKAISVIKKRTGAHERTIREFRLGPGVQLGPPLEAFQGVLAGSPNMRADTQGSV